MQIDVTQDDIADGERRNGEGCPIAIAANRAFGQCCEVGLTQIVLLADEMCYAIPDDARDFILDFDDGCLVRSFSFEATVIIE
jgi:hypothetical protein